MPNDPRMRAVWTCDKCRLSDTLSYPEVRRSEQVYLDALRAHGRTHPDHVDLYQYPGMKHFHVGIYHFASIDNQLPLFERSPE